MKSAVDTFSVLSSHFFLVTNHIQWQMPAVLCMRGLLAAECIWPRGRAGQARPEKLGVEAPWSSPQPSAAGLTDWRERTLSPAFLPAGATTLRHVLHGLSEVQEGMSPGTLQRLPAQWCICPGSLPFPVSMPQSLDNIPWDPFSMQIKYLHLSPYYKIPFWGIPTWIRG